MVTINRKFTVSVSDRHYSEVKSIINKFPIVITKVDSYEETIVGITIRRIYFECISEEEMMDRLVEYFQTKFDKNVNVTF